VCAILDANRTYEVFGDRQTEAGAAFFHWVNRGRGRLCVGGQLTAELGRDGRFREWALQARLSGRLHLSDADTVARATITFSADARVRSNDPHVLALAIVSGARLLFTNDAALQRDFRDSRLIPRPHGKVYSTSGPRGAHPEPGKLTRVHKRLLREFDRFCSTWQPS